MFETLVVPLDGSELAEEALASAEELAAKFRSHVIIVQAVETFAQRVSHSPAIMEPPGAAATNVSILQQAVEAERNEAERYLGGVRERLAGQGLDITAFVGEGGASDVILEVAREQGAGLILMSTHGRGGLGRLVFGSVADAVLRHSEVPVLVIRSKHKT